MQKTTNYQLPKWEKTDRILMDDFNGMTGALDTALHGVAVSAEAAQAAVDSEAADRQAADAALGARITGETAARANAVTAERASCSAALSAETTARINADAAEAAERANADAALQSALNGKAASSHTHAQSAITGLTAALAGKGNCSAILGSYAGSGLYGANNPNILPFPASPKAILIMGTYAFLLFVRGCPYAYGHSYDSYLAPSVTWTDNSVSWYAANAAEQQLNSAGLTYYYIVWY